MQQLYQSNKVHDVLSMSYCRKVVFAIVVLSIIIVSIYSNSFDCSWHFDDEANITDNPNLHLRELSWENIRRALFSNRKTPHVPYRPIACLSFALNYYFGGLDVFGYHLVNIFIHLISSIFLFLFIYHTLNLPNLKEKYAAHSYSIALLATIFWAINPVQIQAVTYIVQRMASLAGMFFILTMYLYLKARLSSSRKQSFLFLAICLLGFLLAIGSKENAAMLPVVIFLYEALLIQENPLSFLRNNLSLILIVLGCTLLLGIGYLYLKGGNVFSFLEGYNNRPFSFIQRLLTEPRIIIFYISLLVYPVPNRLNITHSFQVSTSLFDPITTILSIFLITGVIGYAIYASKKRPLLSFCILFFFINHTIESTIIPLELVFEHRNYIPSMLFFVPIIIGFYYVLDCYKNKRSMQYILFSFIVLFLIGLGHSTFMRNFAWKNEKSLWIDASEKAPNLFRPHHNLGRYYHDHGYKDEALSQYKKALEKSLYNRKDESFVIYYNLGKLYDELKDYNNALYFYNKAALINPSFAPIYNNIAALLDQAGKHELAHKYLLKAIRLHPDSIETNYNMGLYYLRQRQPEKAIDHLHRLVTQKQFSDKVLLYLGIAYKQKGQLGRAVTYLRDALKEDSENPITYLQLAEVFCMAGDKKQAKIKVLQAISQMPEKETLQKILKAVQRIDESRNGQLQATIIIPLIMEACLEKAEMYDNWAKLFQDIPLHLKRKKREINNLNLDQFDGGSGYTAPPN